MRSSFGRLGMLTEQKFWEQHFVPELLGRRKIGLPPAGAKTNKLIVKHVDTRGFCSPLHMYYITLAATGQ